MKKWWIGCSGFSYKHWRDAFYPRGLPRRKWFEYYCESFNTVELNVTFYRYPKPAALRGWHSRSPDHFRFAVKAPRLVTHYKKFRDASRQIADFCDLVGEGLGEKLGCILFQLPPNLVYSAETLDLVLATLDPAFRNVIEFRHGSWWTGSVARSLQKNGAGFCSISYPGLPEQVVRSAPVMYYRFHGTPQLYASPYTMDQLRAVAHDIDRLRGISDVYCYFNNDINAEAVRNARELAVLVGDPPS